MKKKTRNYIIIGVLVILVGLFGLNLLSVGPVYRVCEDSCTNWVLTGKGVGCNPCLANEIASSIAVSPYGTSSVKPFSSVQQFCGDSNPLRNTDYYSKQAICSEASFISCTYKNQILYVNNPQCFGDDLVTCNSNGQVSIETGKCKFPSPGECIWIGPCPANNPNCLCTPRQNGEVCSEDYMCESYNCINGICSGVCTAGEEKCCDPLTDNCNGNEWLLICSDSGGWVQSLEEGKCGYSKPLKTCTDCDSFALSYLLGSIWKSKSCNPSGWTLQWSLFFIKPPQGTTTCLLSLIKLILVPIVLIFSFLFLNEFLANKFKSLRGKKGNIKRLIISALMSVLVAYLVYIAFIVGLVIFIVILLIRIAFPVVMSYVGLKGG